MSSHRASNRASGQRAFRNAVRPQPSLRYSAARLDFTFAETRSHDGALHNPRLAWAATALFIETEEPQAPSSRRGAVARHRAARSLHPSWTNSRRVIARRRHSQAPAKL